MASQLNPYIQLAGTAREAVDFYASVLGGTPEIMTFGQADPSAGPEIAELVMHAYLGTPDGYALMVSDAPPGMPLETGGQVAISLSGDEPGLRAHFEGLAEGGQITVPLERQMWGDHFGMVTDRFGVHWMVNIRGDGAAS